MRDYQTKANAGGAPDSITSTKLGAGETNSFLTEAKTAVSRAGLTPANADGAGEDTTQLAQAIFINSVKASTFADSGSANAYRLTPISGSSGVLLPGGYGALNGMRIYFVPSANNTGNTTINIGQTVGTLLGSKKALTLAGGEIPSGALLASRLAAFTYDASADGGNGAWILDGSYNASSGQFLPLTGGTMSGAIAMGNNKVTGLAAGTVSGDAVHKGQTASTTNTGLVELATQAEAEAGTDAIRAITPLTLRQAFRATGAAPVYACRAWVNFNGTGTVAIRASGNVSSITDNGTGSYTINFATAMPDANYSAIASEGEGVFPSATGNDTGIFLGEHATTSVKVYILSIFEIATDKAFVSVAIFR
jgi:hypothetical protein